MINRNEIYYWIRCSLIEKGYEDIREVSPEKLKETIKEYLKIKCCIENDIPLEELFKKLEILLDQTYKDNQIKDRLMSQFIFYTLNYLSLLQEFEIIWEIDETLVLPEMKKSKYFPDKIDALITSTKMDFISIFNFVFEEAEKVYINQNGFKR